MIVTNVNSPIAFKQLVSLKFKNEDAFEDPRSLMKETETYQTKTLSKLADPLSEKILQNGKLTVKIRDKAGLSPYFEAPTDKGYGQSSRPDLPFNPNFRDYKLARFAEFLEHIQFRQSIKDLSNSIMKTLKPQLESLTEKFQSMASREERISNIVYGGYSFFNKISGLNSHNHQLEINIENNELEDIVNDDQSTIFIMNHRPSGTKYLLADFLTLLYDTYINQQKASKCPLPKVIVTDTIVDASTPEIQSLYKEVGAVPVALSLFPTTNTLNSNLKALIKDVIKDKSNLFIFPEGKMAIFKDLSLKESCLEGINQITRIIASQKKGGVKVIPLGMGYKTTKEGKKIGSIEIGKPIYFIKQGKKMLVNRANIAPDNTDTLHRRFFFDAPNEQYIKMPQGIFRAILRDGDVIEKKDQDAFIGDILLENLDICHKKALQKLPDTFDEDKATVITLEDYILP